MSKQDFVVKGQGWQQLPTPVTSVTNTGFGKVAIAVGQETRTLRENACQKFNRPQMVYVQSESPRGRVTCELPD